MTAAATASRRSLIERAAGRYGLDGLATRPAPPVLPVAAVSRAEPSLPSAVVGAVPLTEDFAQPESLSHGDRVVEPAPASFAAPVVEAAPFDAPIDGIPAQQVFRRPIHAIDRLRLRELCLIEPDGPVTSLLEEFRIVKRQLLLTAAESRKGRGAPHGERILICSAHPGEGKTFTAVNLALSIAAEKDNEVLLVDADFAKPSVLSTLGLPGGAGLMDALVDPAIAVEDCILATDIPGLFVLPAGNPSGHDTEYLASARTRRVLDRLTAQAPSRIVIFDSPPALAASPASELAMHVGQALMVVRADRTGEAALRDAVNILAGCEDIKLLLNGTRFSPTGRRFGSYYGYKD